AMIALGEIAVPCLRPRRPRVKMATGWPGGCDGAEDRLHVRVCHPGRRRRRAVEERASTYGRLASRASWQRDASGHHGAGPAALAVGALQQSPVDALDGGAGRDPEFGSEQDA